MSSFSSVLSEYSRTLTSFAAVLGEFSFETEGAEKSEDERLLGTNSCKNYANLHHTHCHCTHHYFVYHHTTHHHRSPSHYSPSLLTITLDTITAHHHTRHHHYAHHPSTVVADSITICHLFSIFIVEFFRDFTVDRRIPSKFG